MNSSWGPQLQCSLDTSAHSAVSASWPGRQSAGEVHGLGPIESASSGRRSRAQACRARRKRRIFLCGMRAGACSSVAHAAPPGLERPGAPDAHDAHLAGVASVVATSDADAGTAAADAVSTVTASSATSNAGVWTAAADAVGTVAATSLTSADVGLATGAVGMATVPSASSGAYVGTAAADAVRTVAVSSATSDADVWTAAADAVGAVTASSATSNLEVGTAVADAVSTVAASSAWTAAADAGGTVTASSVTSNAEMGLQDFWCLARELWTRAEGCNELEVERLPMHSGLITAGTDELHLTSCTGAGPAARLSDVLAILKSIGSDWLGTGTAMNIVRERIGQMKTDVFFDMIVRLEEKGHIETDVNMSGSESWLRVL